MANHPNRNKSLAQWADVHGTSLEIARVIKRVAADHHEAGSQEHADLMQQIWGDPNPHQIHSIVARAFAETDDDELCWGDETFYRDAADLDSIAKRFAA
jgi:hypothetical protein